MGWYDPVAPDDDLADVLACVWTAHPTGRHLLIPDACIDVLWLSSGRIMLCGPEQRAWSFELPPTTTAAGVRFLPGRFAELLDLDISTIADRRIDLADVVDLDVTVVAGLERATDLMPRVAILQDLVRTWTALAAPSDGFAERIVDVLVGSPHAGAGTIATSFGISTRQLLRRSRRTFGYGTAVLGRLLRFQRFAGIAELAGSDRSVSRLAAEAGYADHGHLGRDCRAITGLTPTDFLATWFPTFPDMSDPYKTVSRWAATMDP